MRTKTPDVDRAFRDARELGVALGATETAIDPPYITWIWERGFLRVWPRDDGTMYCDRLIAPVPGTLTRVFSQGLSWCRDRGFTRFELDVDHGNEEAIYAFLAVGFGVVAHEQYHHRLVASLERGCRFDEYLAWKKGKREEPQWHKALAPLRPSRRSHP